MLNKYDADSIQVLEGLEAVRKRPGMYIGDPSEAFCKMIFEVLDNSIDEVMAGHCNKIDIHIQQNPSKEYYCVVEDNGRGIPIDLYDKKRSTLEVIMTVLHSGGKFDDKNYKYSGGLHGVGISVVNALAKEMQVIITKDYQQYQMDFQYGEKKIELYNLNNKSDNIQNGTLIKFTPDTSIVQEKIPDFDKIIERINYITALNFNLEINLYYFQDFQNKHRSFVSGNSNTRFLQENQNFFIHKPIVILQNETDLLNQYELYACFAFSEDSNRTIKFFTNNIIQENQGTHAIGFKTAITKCITQTIQKNQHNIKKKIPIIKGEDIHGFIHGILSIRLKDPLFTSQIKNQLVSPQARSLVENIIVAKFSKFLEENPQERQLIINFVINKANMRLAMQKIESNFIKQMEKKEVFLAGKLIDCIYANNEKDYKTELFIVEGDGAGGAAAGARDSTFQAILPVQGKILNTYKHHMNKILKNKEIMSIIASVGTNIRDNFDFEKLKYDKIILMSDADDDGKHICTLNLSFFNHFMPKLLEQKKIFIACAPLYKATIKQKVYYLYDHKELQSLLINKFLKNNSIIFNGQQNINEEIFIDLWNFCKNFDQQIDHIKNIDKRILSIVYNYDIFNHPQHVSQLLQEYYQDAVITSTEPGKLNLKSIYKHTNVEIPKLIIDERRELNFVINQQTLIDPINILNLFNKELYEGVILQRYKGLGEMNADELADTTMDIEKRKLKQLFIPEEGDFSFNQRILEIMGDDKKNMRKKFVLENINRLFYKDEQSILVD